MILSGWIKVGLTGTMSLTKRRPAVYLGEWAFEIRVTIPSAASRFLPPVDVTIMDATAAPTTTTREPEPGTDQGEDEGARG